MKALIRISALCLFLTFVAANRLQAQYPGTTLRGQVLTRNQFGQIVPMVSTRVDLLFFNPQYPEGQQWVIVASTLTNVEGFYFFYRIIPNIYTVQVALSRTFNVQVIPIDYRYYAFQTIPQFYF